MKEWRLLGAVALLLAAFLLHAASLDGDFVYDDHRFIVFNPALDAMDLGAYFSDPQTASNTDGVQADIYRPIRTTLFALERRAFGASPKGWHTVSVWLHALNVALCFLWIAALIRSNWAAMFGALLFAVHPVTSESVAWISSQGDLLAVLFGLLTMLCFLRAGWLWTLLGCLSFAAACLSKESALMLPGLVLLQAWVRPPQNADSPDPSNSLLARPGNQTWIRLGVMSGWIAAYFLIRQAVMGGTLAQVPHPGDSVWASVRAMLDGFVTYVQGLLLPLGFSFDTHTVVPVRFTDPKVVLGLGMLCTLVAGGLFALRRRRYAVALACLGFLVTLVPVSNVIVPLKTFVADRFLYPGLLCIGLGAAVAAQAVVGALRTKGWAFRLGLAGATVGVLGIVALAGLLGERNRAWADDVSLWTAVRNDRPNNPNAYYGLAFDHARNHRLSEAERAFRSYLEFNPIDGKAMMQLGDVFGEVASTLELQGPNAAQLRAETDIDENRQSALEAQMRAYRRAFEIWNVHGLARGRGSPAVADRMLLRWMKAAAAYGDLREAKFANDQRLHFAGTDPRKPTTSATSTSAPMHLRMNRMFLALLALEPSASPASVAIRAQLLRDVGLNPRRTNDTLLSAWERTLAGLMREAESTGAAVTPDMYLRRVQVLLRLKRIDAARAVVSEAQRRFPTHPGIDATFRQMGGK